MDYQSLRVAVSDYTENAFSDTDFAIMTKLAEQSIYNTVQLPTLRKNAILTLTPSNKFIAAPNDFLSVFSLAVITPAGDFNFLIDKDTNFIREAYPSQSSIGLPKYYAIFGPPTAQPNELQFILGPAPDLAYQAELHYFYYPESIVTAGTSWLGDNFDSVLFNGVMVEAARFMKEEADIVQMNEQRFAQSLLLVKQLGDGKQRGDAYRDGQVKQRVN